MNAQRTLVICIGNTARGDDGIAHRVARLIAADATKHGATVVTAVGLDVAMAEDVMKARRLIVVDAERRVEPPVTISAIQPGTAAHSGHSIDAPGLLAVTASLYGSAPPATLVSVAAPHMGHGATLSAMAKAASEEAAHTVTSLLREA